MKSSANFGHAQLSTTFGLMFGRRGTLRRPEFRRQGHGQPWSVGVRLRSHATRKRGRPRHHPVPLYMYLCAACVYGRTTNAQNSDPIRPNQPGAIRSAAGSHASRRGRIACASRGRRETERDGSWMLGMQYGNTEGHSRVRSAVFSAAGGSAFVITSVPQYAPVYAKANTVSRK